MTSESIVTIPVYKYIILENMEVNTTFSWYVDSGKFKFSSVVYHINFADQVSHMCYFISALVVGCVQFCESQGFCMAWNPYMVMSLLPVFTRSSYLYTWKYIESTPGVIHSSINIGNFGENMEGRTSRNLITIFDNVNDLNC